jgi:hypothetical protein
MFTHFIERLVGGGGLLSNEECDELWEALRAVLRAELQRRGLWSRPPSYLGIYGHGSWEETAAAAEVAETIENGDGNGGVGGVGAAGSGRRAADRVDALEDLTAGCYTFIFIDRLRSLAAQLRVKPDVEGLVLLGVRHYLHGLRKRHDPVGFQVFAVTREAVRLAAARGDLAIAGGDPRVRNDTVLALFPVAGAGPAAAEGPGAAAELHSLVQSWNDRLFPDLVTASGRALDEVAERLSRCLPELRRHGLRRIQFKDLIDSLKTDARTRWAASLQQSCTYGAANTEDGRGGGGHGLDPALGRPDLDLERQAGFLSLTRGVAAAVDRLDTDARTRGYLVRLWAFLSVSAANDDEADGGGAAAAGGAIAPGGGKAPSHRQLERLLGIPRDRLPDLYQTLRLLVREHRARGGAADPGAGVATDQTGTAPRQPGASRASRRGGAGGGRGR